MARDSRQGGGASSVHWWRFRPGGWQWCGSSGERGATDGPRSGTAAGLITLGRPSAPMGCGMPLRDRRLQASLRRRGSAFIDDGNGNTECHFKDGSWTECDANGGDCWHTPPPKLQTPGGTIVEPGTAVADDPGGWQPAASVAQASVAAPNDDQAQDQDKTKKGKKGKKSKKGGKGRKRNAPHTVSLHFIDPASRYVARLKLPRPGA